MAIPEYRKIYEKVHGKIPIGYHIHHIDGNNKNNDISNLKLVTAEEHFTIHLEQNDFGACWAMLRTGHVILTTEQRSEISRNQMLHQWKENRSKMLSAVRNRDTSTLIGRTWKLTKEQKQKVIKNLNQFNSETARLCKDTIWINDGNKNKRIKSNETIPEGFTKGRLFTPWNKGKINV